MRTTLLCTLALLLLAAAAGCQKNAATSDEQQIRAAIDAHLATRTGLNLAGMEKDVRKVTVTGAMATADVEFRSKPGGVSMMVTYNLEKQGNTWAVKKSTSTGVGHPPTDAPEAAPGNAPRGELPTGHPPVSAPPKKN